MICVLQIEEFRIVANDFCERFKKFIHNEWGERIMLLPLHDRGRRSKAETESF